MRVARRPSVLRPLPILLAGAIVVAAISTSGSLASRRTASASAVGRDLTLSFDAKPAYSEWWGIQPGYGCVNGAVDQSAPTKPPSAAFVRDDSPGNVRHGRYSARVVLSPGDHAAYTCKAEAVAAIKRVNEGEGSQSWWGWSWKLPRGWRGTDSWGMLFEFTANHVLWPSYGMLNFDASTRNSLALQLHTGLTPNPGSVEYNSAYEKRVTLLGPHAPRPMVYGKWLDFYMHIVWRSRTSGVLQIWYRVDVQKRFTMLYSNVPGDRSLIRASPHPTLLYNTTAGAPGNIGRPGLVLEGGFYRASTRWKNTYWWDGMRRRQTKASILRGFQSPSS
jgi:Polysaccharide lyase